MMFTNIKSSIRVRSFLSAMTAALAVLIMAGSAVGQTETWECGAVQNAGGAGSVTCTYHEDGTFVVSGSGDMKSYDMAHIPWSGGYFTITKVIVEEGVTSIGADAFTNCNKLKSVKLPSTLREIGNGAFFACHILETITLPVNLEFILSGAFGNCFALKTIISLASEPPLSIGDPFQSPNPLDMSSYYLYVPEESISAYQATGWGFTYIGRIKAITPDMLSVRYHVSRAAAVGSRIAVRNRTLTVRGASSEAVSRVRLIDMRGKSVASFTARGEGSFSLAKIPSGRYFVEVRDGARRDRASVIIGVR